MLPPQNDAGSGDHVGSRGIVVCKSVFNYGGFELVTPTSRFTLTGDSWWLQFLFFLFFFFWLWRFWASRLAHALLNLFLIIAILSWSFSFRFTHGREIMVVSLFLNMAVLSWSFNSRFTHWREIIVANLFLIIAILRWSFSSRFTHRRDYGCTFKKKEKKEYYCCKFVFNYGDSELVV